MKVLQKSRQATLAAILLASLLFGVNQRIGAVGKTPLPQKTLLSSFPTIKQMPNYCGPASLCSVLRFWGQDIDQKKIASQVYDPKLQATNGADMLLYARDQGYSAYSWNSSMEDLKRKVVEGMPVIALTDSSLSDKSGHFRVVTGYDDEKQVVNVMDPYDNDTRTIPYVIFQKLWDRHGNWGLLVVPEPQDKFRKELYDNNPVVHIDLAYVFYRRGRLNDAAEEGGRALALEPRNPDVLSLLSKVKKDIQYAAGTKTDDKK